MIEQRRSRLVESFARLSTGLKMMLILGLGLFPLGLIAILASVETATDKRVERRDAAAARVQLQAQRIDSAIGRLVLTIRSANAAVAATSPQSGVCEATLQRLSQVRELQGRYALFAGEFRPRCATPGYRPSWPQPLMDQAQSVVEIVPDRDMLRIAVFDPAGRPEGTAEFSRAVLSELAVLPGAVRMPYDLVLEQAGRVMRLRQDLGSRSVGDIIEVEAPALGGRLTLRLRAAAEPIGAAELIIILLPVVMWLAAGAIGWAIVNVLLLKPLGRMESAVSAYQPGDRHLDLPALSTPAKEIGALGSAFDQLTRTVARHEGELEAALERQTLLVREVHHRVKNNLQVVASLLNLHARGATSDDVAAAYASIQRRVDALAVVHRNHFAELEENRGVSLRSLISELGANLRATAPVEASSMPLRIDIEPFYVTQDVAVSVAFLITELVEFVMFCGAGGVVITLERNDRGGARLSLQSDSLRGPSTCDERLFDRFDRIVTGLSRQLRSPLERDGEQGRYALDIMVTGRAEFGEAA